MIIEKPEFKKLNFTEKELSNIKIKLKYYSTEEINYCGFIEKCKIYKISNNHKVAFLQNLGFILLRNRFSIPDKNGTKYCYECNLRSFYIGQDSKYIYWQRQKKTEGRKSYFHLICAREIIHKNN